MRTIRFVLQNGAVPARLGDRRLFHDSTNDQLSRTALAHATISLVPTNIAKTSLSVSSASRLTFSSAARIPWTEHFQITVESEALSNRSYSRSAMWLLPLLFVSRKAAASLCRMVQNAGFVKGNEHSRIPLDRKLPLEEAGESSAATSHLLLAHWRILS